MTLNVPQAATKADVEAAFAETRRKLRAKGCKEGSSEFEQVDRAYQTLSDASARKAYDQQLGLASKRKDRSELRPLGFFSKSLSKAQQAWTVWERELLAAVEVLTHFYSLLAGLVVILHTDHLNSTVLSQALRQPEKVLRMLLRVETISQSILEV